MTVIWEWNGTKAQIVSLDWPTGYATHMELISVVNFAGRTCVKIGTAERGDQGGEGTSEFSINVHTQKDYWMRMLVFIPSENSYIQNDGSLGWMLLNGGVGYLITTPDGLWSWQVGDFLFNEGPTTNGLMIKPRLKPTAFTDNFYGGYWSGRFPKGKWVEWIDHYIIHPTQGRVTSWINGELVFDSTNQCTDPSQAWNDPTAIPKVRFRHYPVNEIRHPQHVYFAEMKIQTEPFVSQPPVEPPTLPPVEPPVIPPTGRTLVAQALPYPLLLAKLWTLRKRFIREDIHRKVHPWI